MNSDRIKEIQKETTYPESVSVMLALKQVWNECEQENQLKKKELKAVIKGNAFQESHGSTTLVVDLEAVISLIDE